MRGVLRHTRRTTSPAPDHTVQDQTKDHSDKFFHLALCTAAAASVRIITAGAGVFRSFVFDTI